MNIIFSLKLSLLVNLLLSVILVDLLHLRVLTIPPARADSHLHIPLNLLDLRDSTPSHHSAQHSRKLLGPLENCSMLAKTAHPSRNMIDPRETCSARSKTAHPSVKPARPARKLFNPLENCSTLAPGSPRLLMKRLLFLNVEYTIDRKNTRPGKLVW